MKRKKLFAAVLAFCLILSVAVPALADEGTNPIDAINNLIQIVYMLVMLAGILFVIFGVVQLAMALKEQDPSRKANAVLSIIGGVLCIGVRYMVQWLTTGFNG